jgi:carbon-monoxide dehydrogenase iron sulfur subunit
MKRIYAKEDLCIGCRLCEIHCLVQHSRSKRILTAMMREKDTVTPRVKVEESGQLTFALQCRHCENARCLEACMTGAIRRDPETGVILHDESKCVGCWMCVMTCPVGAVQCGREGHVASKCDLCQGEKVPACVQNCPNEALVFEERSK